MQIKNTLLLANDIDFHRYYWRLLHQSIINNKQNTILHHLHDPFSLRETVNSSKIDFLKLGFVKYVVNPADSQYYLQNIVATFFHNSNFSMQYLVKTAFWYHIQKQFASQASLYSNSEKALTSDELNNLTFTIDHKIKKEELKLNNITDSMVKNAENMLEYFNAVYKRNLNVFKLSQKPMRIIKFDKNINEYPLDYNNCLTVFDNKQYGGQTLIDLNKDKWINLSINDATDYCIAQGLNKNDVLDIYNLKDMNINEILTLMDELRNTNNHLVFIENMQKLLNVIGSKLHDTAVNSFINSFDQYIEIDNHEMKLADNYHFKHAKIIDKFDLR